MGTARSISTISKSLHWNGNDPINLIDPSGGWAATGVFEGMSRASIMATTTLGGAIVGMGVDLLSGGNGGKGLLIGATLGLGSNFSLGNFVSASLNVGGEVLSNAVSNSVISQSTNSYAKWAGYNGNSFSSFKTLLTGNTTQQVGYTIYQRTFAPWDRFGNAFHPTRFKMVEYGEIAEVFQLL